VIIVVRGIPAPQGSKRHVGGGRMIESSRAVGPWREAVRAQTQNAMHGNGFVPAEGPCAVFINFYLPRPKSTPKKITLPIKRPDLDKLVRAVLDGMTEGGAWLDDAVVVRLQAQKNYAGESNPPGCTIEIRGVPQ
jgi:crossover junction endodeoxyribonuclease RusA